MKGETVMDITQLIANLGFPIAACIGMAWFVVKQIGGLKDEINKMREAYQKDHDSTIEALANNTNAMNALVSRLEKED